MSKLIFEKEGKGRSGKIFCRDDKHFVSMDWEISGSSEYDILIGPVDLRKWSFPEGEEIILDKQKYILQELRAWLKEKRIKSNLEIGNIDTQNRQCIWDGCKQIRRAGSFYCERHIDETTLRK